MFQINDVYEPDLADEIIKGGVRVVDCHPDRGVALIRTDIKPAQSPFVIPYDEFISRLNISLNKVSDPFEPKSRPMGDLPPAASQRLVDATNVINRIAAENVLLKKRGLSKSLRQIADETSISEKTLRRWVYSWLQAGFNVEIIVSHLQADPSTAPRPQTSPVKRGRKPKLTQLSSGVAAPQVRKVVETHVRRFVLTRKKTRSDAYMDMLLEDFDIPRDQLVTTSSNKGLLLDGELLKKYLVPSRNQFDYICNILSKHRSRSRISRSGRATDGVPGPGFFEIDATILQIRLVSRWTKSRLVSRPVVYLIIDVFSTAIVGYALSLDNMSWSVAASAIANALEDKGATFKRLGLPYESDCWPCRHAPTHLTADRAELITNQGQKLAGSGIDVAITPAMCPIAKGTVEGNNAQVKRSFAEIDFPGRFEKIRRRRSPTGDERACMDIEQLEQIVVEVICDLNNDPVASDRIPRDAVECGAYAVTRVGLYTWGLTHRAGFTRSVMPDFTFKYLLKHDRARMTSRGLLFKNQLYTCDRLHTIEWQTRPDGGASFEIDIAYDARIAAEIYFVDPQTRCWTKAMNQDLDVARIGVSFAELEEFEAQKAAVIQQAQLNNRERGRPARAKAAATIKQASAERKAQETVLGAARKSKKAIRENRAAEQRGTRRSIVQPPETLSAQGSQALPPAPDLSALAASATESAHDQSTPASDSDGFSGYWDKLPTARF